MKSKLLLGIALSGLLLAACMESTPGAERRDSQAVQSQLTRLQAGQPTPEFAFSQLRQTLIEIQKAQANTTQTTSFFFNQGSVDPINVCPSIGFPIPSTAQLTSPERAIEDHNGGNYTLPQAEQTGVYTGDSSGTYALCVDNTGKPFAFYWEGFVSTVSGPAEWDSAAKRIKLTGAPTGNFTKK